MPICNKYHPGTVELTEFSRFLLASHAYDVLRCDYKNGKNRMIGEVLRHKGNGRIFYGVLKGLCTYPLGQVVLVNGGVEYYMVSKEQYMQIFSVTL